MERRLVEQVWQRAERQCEYCHFPAVYALVPFQIDHIIAEKHDGQTVLPNLALACYYCNNFKGPNVAGVDSKTRKIVRLYHPRTDQWEQHFRWIGAVLEGVTPIGRATIQVLNINREDAVLVRQSLLKENQ